MDGGGRLLRSLDLAPAVAGRGSVRPQHPIFHERMFVGRPRPRSLSERLVRLATRRRIGGLLTALFLGGTLSYGVTLGGHWPEVRAGAFAIPDALARAAGFRIASIAVDGRYAITDREILAALDFGSGRSLLLLDAGAARERLIANPLVRDATVRKLYPDKLAITLEEREPYALWQRDGELAVIAADGTVIDLARDGRFSNLPLLVGLGAARSAAEILTVLKDHPDLMERTYAAVRVGDRRWNLRLTNGVDVKLPATGLAAAVTSLLDMQQSARLLDRDITTIDLRQPDMITVRLSDEAVAAEAKAQKKASRRGGST